MHKSLDVTVTGRVQGVSYRWCTGQEADRLGVTGWVANEPDGSVAGHFEGDGPAVDALVAWCRTGPRLAHVERVDVRPAPDEGLASFEIR